jgi:hypothetical protein
VASCLGMDYDPRQDQAALEAEFKIESPPAGSGAISPLSATRSSVTARTSSRPTAPRSSASTTCSTRSTRSSTGSRNSSQYQDYQARIEPGIILAGSPGTGKTSTARYIATKSKAFFVNVRDFPHQGNLFSDSDIRDLFRRSREKYAADQDSRSSSSGTSSRVSPRSGRVTTPRRSGSRRLSAYLRARGRTRQERGHPADRLHQLPLRHRPRARRSGRLGLHFEFTAPDRKGKEKILAFYLGQKHSRDGIDVRRSRTSSTRARLRPTSRRPARRHGGTRLVVTSTATTVSSRPSPRKTW